MRKLRANLMRIAATLAGRRDDNDFAGELEAHLQMHIDDGIRAGLTPEEARRRALIRLGGMEQTRQERPSVAVALDACWIPARRAASISPTDALRAD